ncbi:EAL domain-containing protein [Marinobacterium aestuariivivens]|uniref:EAL domain-containing protein n=1 Tax=Marinobacterium aestuariivivens TaxID=1698799 RepID=A0ABW1ZVL1_9GAMM
MTLPRPFVSLKWKVTLVLLLTLSLVHGLAVGIFYYQRLHEYSEDRQQLRQNQFRMLDGMVAEGYGRLLDIAQTVAPTGVPAQRTPEGLLRAVGDRAGALVRQSILDLVQLYRSDGSLVRSWGEAMEVRTDWVRQVRVREQPVQDIHCNRGCMQYVAIPVMLADGDSAVLLVGRLMYDLVVNFHRQSGADLGLVTESGVADGWQILSLTNRSYNEPLLEGLSLMPGRPQDKVLDLERGRRHLELMLAPVVAGAPDGAYWVLIIDIGPELAALQQRFFSSLALASLGTLLALLLQVLLLRRPLNYIRSLSQRLPLLASSPELRQRKLRQLPEPLHRWHFPDELEVLSGSAAELSSRLEQLEDSVADRTLRLEQRSAALLRERDFVNRLFDTADAVILTQDADGRILTLNRYGIRLLGLDPARQPGCLFVETVLDEHDETGKARMQRLYLGLDSRLAMDSRYHTTAGRDIQLSWQHSCLDDSLPGEASILSIAIDMTERRDAESRLYWLANHDALTRLPNRLLFFDDLSQRMADVGTRRGQLAVLCCDVDDFKDVNDTLGHRIGDKLLQAVARRIFELAGEDCCVSRLGADEFVLMLESDDAHDAAAQMAERLIRVFIEPFHIEGYELYSSISIGISLFPEQGAEASDLVRHADLAMIEAKGQGQGRYRFYHEAQGSSRVERFTLANDLRRALEQGEFSLHYQPKIDAHTGQVCGLESLIRWQHAEYGMVSPGRFIPLAEEMGLIVPIGRWVLQEACRQMAEWQAAGMAPIRVGVNLAGPQIAHESLLEHVDQALDAAGLSPQLLDLEITESFAIRQPELTIGKLNQLRERGITLSMDDFGTGYSSLSYLKRFPIDTLKIDQSFVRDIGRDSDDEAIVRAIIVLCQSLGIKVLAEGVETDEQLQFLLRNGCSTIQGYYFSKPLPPDELFDYVMEHQ